MDTKRAIGVGQALGYGATDSIRRWGSAGSSHHIFKGTGKRIPKTETDQYDKRVRVMWQRNAWCDEKIMKEWISTEWNSSFKNPPTAGSSGKLLVADVHTAQQTNDVKAALSRRNTKLSNVPPGCTSRVQVLDVSVNKPFKTQVRDQFEEHLIENMERVMNGEILVRERRILTTRWVANAWSYICIVKRGYKKCGINVALDGNENPLVNIEGLPDYGIPIGDLSEEYTLEDESDSDENIGEDENPRDEDPPPRTSRAIVTRSRIPMK